MMSLWSIPSDVVQARILDFLPLILTCRQAISWLSRRAVLDNLVEQQVQTQVYYYGFRTGANIWFDRRKLKMPIVHADIPGIADFRRYDSEPNLDVSHVHRVTSRIINVNGRVVPHSLTLPSIVVERKSVYPVVDWVVHSQRWHRYGKLHRDAVDASGMYEPAQIVYSDYYKSLYSVLSIVGDSRAGGLEHCINAEVHRYGILQMQYKVGHNGDRCYTLRSEANAHIPNARCITWRDAAGGKYRDHDLPTRIWLSNGVPYRWEWHDINSRLHRADGPAVVDLSLGVLFEYYSHGLRHRLTGPAQVCLAPLGCDVSFIQHQPNDVISVRPDVLARYTPHTVAPRFWSKDIHVPVTIYVELCIFHPQMYTVRMAHYKDNNLHRTDGPAIITQYPSGKPKLEKWLLDGKLSREGGPAVTEWWPSGQRQYEEWFSQGQHLRAGGPTYSGWHENGQPQCEKWQRDNKLHCLDGPALMQWDVNGVTTHVRWAIDDKYHRGGDQPAVFKTLHNGCSYNWWVNGHRHRDGDRPAVINKNKAGKVIKQSWWNNGTFVRAEILNKRKR